MQHLGTVSQQTPRLVLRRFAVQDAEKMYQNWCSDPQVTKYLMWPTHDSVDVTKQVLEDWVGHYGEPNYYHWAITLREGGEPIGSIGVMRQDDCTQMAHIGYCIGQKWWRQGYTSEALAAVMRFLFHEVGVNRVESRHDPRNPNSGRVMQKCGMKYEGTLREADWNNQGICDCAMYAILKSEYGG